MLADTMTFSRLTEEVSGLSDAEILVRSAGEPELFRELVRRYEAPFLRRARTILRVTEDADEVVQDAFTKIYLYADRFQPQPGASFSSWAYTILNRVAYTRYAKQKQIRSGEVALDPEYYEALPDTTSFLEDLTIRNEVLAVLAKLPETAARILRLQFIEGKTQEEIAETEQLSIPAVKTRVHRAKKLFKDIYDTQR